ncbi:hypothetical protein CB1_000459002 [Camelus ferus]|nr:hypothetical protein CB1_000459002 [Camelus ferus]
MPLDVVSDLAVLVPPPGSVPSGPHRGRHRNTTEQPHYQAQQFCGWEVKLLCLTVTGRPLFSFQEEPPRVAFSLCTACLFQQNGLKGNEFIISPVAGLGLFYTPPPGKTPPYTCTRKVMHVRFVIQWFPSLLRVSKAIMPSHEEHLMLPGC